MRLSGESLMRWFRRSTSQTGKSFKTTGPTSPTNETSSSIALNPSTESATAESSIAYAWDDGGQFDDVFKEMKRAIEKHGFENTPMAGEMTHGAALAILVEEVGECARALCDDNPDQLYKELNEVAAMAIGWRMGMTRHD